MKEQLTQKQINTYSEILWNEEHYMTVKKLALELLKVNKGELHEKEGALKVIFDPNRICFFERKNDQGIERYFGLEKDWGDVTNIKQWEFFMRCFVDAFIMLSEANHFNNAC